MRKSRLILLYPVLVILLGSILPSFITFADPSIEVAPITYDFGDVPVGTSRTVIITITNVNGHILEITQISLSDSSDFSITSQPELPLSIETGSLEEVMVTFTPSSTGYCTATLDIESNDLSNTVVSVPLGGTGVSIEPPPPSSIADILAFFDASIADGTLYGYGPGKSADGRYNVLRNMIEASGDLLENQMTFEACQQLMDAYERCDGLSHPPEFVAGPAAPTLACMILNLIGSLGCQ